MSSNRCASPNVRNSESNSSIRRSFSGNTFGRPSVLTNSRSFVVPNTPANSPAEFGRRQIGGKEGLSRSFEEKENEKDTNLKGVKFKSPSKGGKHFMAPTISASSKFTPSPRKKILGEVNELVRTSISFDGKEAEDFHSKSEEMGIEENTLADFDKKEVVLEVPKASKRVTFCEVPLNSDVDSEFLSEISSRSDCVVLGDIFPPAPLDSHDDYANAEPISNNLFCSTPVSLMLAPTEIPSIPKASNGDTLVQIPLTSHDESETVSGKIMNSDSVNAGSGSGFINKTCSSSEISPLDADLSFPPYDPKTNYLSPRPKFLRYKPNARIEVFLSKGKGLEESFGISDTSSDTDVTEETLSGDSHKESEDGCSPDMPTSEEEQEEKPAISESIPMSSPISSHSPEQTSEVKKAPRLFTGLKSVFLVLMLLIAFASISVTDVPVLDSPAIKDSSFYKLYEASEVAMFAKEKLDGYARTLLIWSSQAISFLSSCVPRFGEADHWGTLQFSNLTFLEESPLVDGFLGFNHLNSYKIEEISEDEIIESLEEDDDEFESVEEGDAEIMESLEERTESGMVDGHSEVESGHDGGSEVEEMLLAVQQVEVRVSESSEDVVDHEPSGATAHIAAEPEKSNAGHIEDQLVFVNSQAAQIRPAIEPVEINQVVPMETQVDNVFSSSKTEVDCAEEKSVHSSKLVAITQTDSSPIYATEYKLSSIFQIYAIVLAIVATVITIPFIYMKKPCNKSTTPNTVTHGDPLQKAVCSPLPAGLMYTNKPFSQTGPTEFDMSGESSYPSEMSSFQKSSSKGASKGNKAQSQERKPRNSAAKRESLASSEYSTGSPSYGSFTTHERIPVKHAYGEDEIVTPVRRSSRIRSQVVSQ